MNHLSQVGVLMRWAVYKNLACQFFFYNNWCTWFIKIIEREDRFLFATYSIFVLIQIIYNQCSNLENKSFWEVSDYLIFYFSEDWSIKKSKKMLEVIGKIVWYSKTIWQGKMMKYCGRWVFLRNFRLSHIMLPERLEYY